MKSEIAQNREKIRPWLFSWMAIGAIYSGGRFIETQLITFDYSGGDISLTIGLILFLVAVWLYIFFPHRYVMPVITAVGTQIMALYGGILREDLTYYFYLLFLGIAGISTVKNYKLLVICASVMLAINVGVIFLLLPQLPWADPFNFSLGLVMFLCGVVFIAIQTRKIELKVTAAERAMQAFSSLLHSTPNLIAITDAKKNVLYLSEPMVDFIKCKSKKDAVGQELVDLIKIKELKFEVSKMLEAKGFYETEIEINTGGESKYLKGISDKLIGEIEGTFIDITDITSIVEARIEAKQASKSKSKFLATMSHEIRTPLNAILGIAQIQLQKSNIPQETRIALEKVYKSGKNLLGIINDILDMSKIETGKLELNLSEYETSTLINDAVQLNIVRIGSRPIEFLLEIDEDMPSYLFGDELRIKQILNNLLSNAIKYTEKGFVKLSINHAVKNDSIIMRFIVEDTGQGMKPDDVEKLFSEYQRFNIDKNNYTEGTGIGLNITRNLVKMMGGKISAESEYGKGSKFTFIIKQKMVDCAPLSAETIEKLRKFSFLGDNKDESTKKITYTPMPYGKVLIVDDVETNLYVAMGLLSPYKLEIETVTSGFDAIEKIKNDKVYDIIFMDHMMPKMDGIETTLNIRRIGYKGTIVALTANALVGNDKMFKEKGFDGFISKPIDIRQMDKILNEFILKKYPEEAEKYRAETIKNPAVEDIDLYIDGVDVNLGLKRTGGIRNFYLQTLVVFHKDGVQKISELKSCLKNGNYSLYATFAHALKSALANIGATNLSDAAKELETAAKESDVEYLNKKTDKFLSELQTLLENIDSVLPKSENNAEKLDSEILKSLKTALAAYDLTAIDSAVNYLRDFKQAESIIEKILMGDYDEAAEDVESLIKMG